MTRRGIELQSSGPSLVNNYKFKKLFLTQIIYLVLIWYGFKNSYHIQIIFKQIYLNGTLTDTTIPGCSRPGSNGNKGVPPSPQSPKLELLHQMHFSVIPRIPLLGWRMFSHCTCFPLSIFFFLAEQKFSIRFYQIVGKLVLIFLKCWKVGLQIWCYEPFQSFWLASPLQRRKNVSLKWLRETSQQQKYWNSWEDS